MSEIKLGPGLVLPIEAVTETGTHPAGWEPGCTCDQLDVTPRPGTPREWVRGTADPACPEHGSQP